MNDLIVVKELSVISEAKIDYSRGTNKLDMSSEIINKSTYS